MNSGYYRLLIQRIAHTNRSPWKSQLNPPSLGGRPQLVRSMNLFLGSGISRKIALAAKILRRKFKRQEALLTFGMDGGVADPKIGRVMIINLDRQPSRWKFFASEARRLKIVSGQSLFEYCERISAVDAKDGKLSAAREDVCTFYTLESQYQVDPDPRLLPRIREGEVRIQMTEQEVAVALSHLNAWRRVVQNDIPYALIMEDDVFFEANFARELNKTWAALPEARPDESRFDALYLSFREVEFGARRHLVYPELVRVVGGYWWLSGYVLSQSGARKLLDSLPITGPVDLWFNLQLSRLDAYSTPTSLISQRVDLPSDNSYSILPILSQLGIQSDRTHLLLEGTKGRSPVFALGFLRADAEWLHLALSLLGYRCCNDPAGRFEKNIRQLIEINSPLLFDAYVNVSPVTDAYRELDTLYPDAVFLLPIGESRSALRSERLRAIRDHFSQRPERCAFVGSGPEAWSSICEVLQCPLPKYAAPEIPNVIELPALDSGETVSPCEQRHESMQHDVHPWIVPKERYAAFGVQHEQRNRGLRRGEFTLVRRDNLTVFDNSWWIPLEDTFPSNQAAFSRENLKFGLTGCSLNLTKGKRLARSYKAASFASRESHHFGRFEAVIRPVKLPGVLTAFFLHRTDPWQEIDLEILGRDTTRVLTNVYFNPGMAGTGCNYGNRGSPTLVDLGFDAAKDYHAYAIEWEPEEIRWFVDDKLIHVRRVWEPTPVPNLPMQLHCSLWPPRSTELAGEINDAALPAASEVREITVSTWRIANKDDDMKGPLERRSFSNR